MLKRALFEIKQMTAFSISKLAKNLNIDIGMAEQLVNQLKIMGYIKEEKINRHCDGNCSGCFYSCNSKPIKLLTITKKGSNVLDKISA